MSPKYIRRLINLWPPLFFSGIRVKSITEDWSQVVVELRLTWWNRNAVGTMFGGSLFAMTDPFYPLMLQHNLGPEYIVWAKSAAIEFLSPGRTVARASFSLSADTVAEIRAATEDGAKYEPAFSATISDPEGKVVARVNMIIYVRRKRVKAGEQLL